MKKEYLIGIAVFALLLIVGLLVMTMGTEAKGDYKEGTYFGHHQYTSYGKEYVTTAVVYIDENGSIKSVFVDNTYLKDEVYSTKKVLGDDYGMKATSANIGVIEGGAEWYEQVSLIEEKVVEEQGLEWLTYTDEEKTKTDVITGVTITVNTYHAAIKNALDLAK